MTDQPILEARGLYIRLPGDTKEWLRKTAFDERRSQSALVTEAVEMYRKIKETNA